MAKYLTTSDPFSNKTIYGTPYFNHSGRAYPDVAAVGLDILLYAEGQPNFLGGTSASAPIFASMITLINERRLDAGKKRVGFLNPTLYKNPDAFTDVSLDMKEKIHTDGKTDYYREQSGLQYSRFQLCQGVGSGDWTWHSNLRQAVRSFHGSAITQKSFEPGMRFTGMDWNLMDAYLGSVSICLRFGEYVMEEDIHIVSFTQYNHLQDIYHLPPLRSWEYITEWHDLCSQNHYITSKCIFNLMLLPRFRPLA